MRKKILITGATGLIGTALTRRLCSEGAYVKMLTRNAKNATGMFDKHFSLEALEYEKYDTPNLLAKILSDIDVVVNLAGANIGGKRWNKEYKRIIYDSRIDLTRLLVSAIHLSDSKPACLINASGVGIYGDTKDELVTEESRPGNDFLANLCKDWEREAMKAFGLGVRVVAIRTGIVLDKKGGALPKLLFPFKFFVGAYQGSGKQWLSWIHIDDIVSLYTYSIENDELTGPVNGTSPEPVRNKGFVKSAGHVLNRNVAISAPAFALRLAIGEFAESLLTGQRAIPEKAVAAGFEFAFPDLNGALKNLLNS
ncbi:MAG: TIGR01777 family oxidoreductase [Ignavibacteria bacterium]